MLLAAQLIAGTLLGTMFFGGLWWTTVRGMASPRPALWFCGSLLLRMVLAAAGFFFVGREDWRRWLMCLLGFIFARLIVQWLIRAGVQRPCSRDLRSHYAP